MSALKTLFSGAGGAAQLYPEDVFYALPFVGNSGVNTLAVPLDMTTKGGMIAIQNRNAGYKRTVQDTVGGFTANNILLSSDSYAAYASGYGSSPVTALSPASITLGNTTQTNYNGYSYVLWAFRKAPKFFAIVYYTGDGVVNRQVSHDLGIAPGIVDSKSLSADGQWNTFHVAATGDMHLNQTAAQAGSRASMPAVSATTFTVTGLANANGVSYAAYLWADDNGPDGLIRCGSYVHGGSPVSVNLGWEVQYLELKSASSASDWVILDTARGLPVGANAPCLRANIGQSESANKMISPTATGFISYSTAVFSAGDTVLYKAIRRPCKPPTNGSQVFQGIARTGTGISASIVGVGGYPDLVISKGRNANYNAGWMTRLLGSASQIISSSTRVEDTYQNMLTSFDPDGFSVGADNGLCYINNSPYQYIIWTFRRAAAVFDTVVYAGDSTNTGRTIPHGLGAVPQLLLLYCRESGNFLALSTILGSYGYMNGNYSFNTNSIANNFGNLSTYIAPTSNTFTVGYNSNVNYYGNNFVAYLFATKSGISKVDIYTGNGTSQNLDFGFSAGTRFFLVKRTDADGDWYVWDSVRGITVGNDIAISISALNAQDITTADSVDPYSAGLTVKQNTTTNINVSGATYLYLAIA